MQTWLSQGYVHDILNGKPLNGSTGAKKGRKSKGSSKGTDALLDAAFVPRESLHLWRTHPVVISFAWLWRINVHQLWAQVWLKCRSSYSWA